MVYQILTLVRDAAKAIGQNPEIALRMLMVSIPEPAS